MPLTPIVSGSTYLTLPRSPETWLIEPILPSGGAVLLYGDPKVGKSYAAIQLTLALQEGKDWLGFPVRRKCRVVYVQLDTPRSLWASRLEELHLTPEQIGLLLLADRETLECFPFDILNPIHHDLLKTSLRDLSPDVVIIDTLRESHGGDENDSTQMKMVLSSFDSAIQPAAAIYVHHSKKPSIDGGKSTINDMRGGYIAGKMDSILRLSPKTLYFTGRAIEEGSIHIRREDNGFWRADIDETERHIESIIVDPAYSSVRQQASALSQRIGKSEEACRALLRRRRIHK